MRYVAAVAAFGLLVFPISVRGQDDKPRTVLERKESFGQFTVTLWPKPWPGEGFLMEQREETVSTPTTITYYYAGTRDTELYIERVETRRYRLGTTGVDSQERGRLRIVLPLDSNREARLRLRPLHHNVVLVFRLKLESDSTLSVSTLSADAR